MTTKEIISKLEGMPEGALITNLNRYDFGFMLNTLNTFRAAYIRETYSKKHRLNPVLYQKVYPRWERDLKEDCFTQFRFPIPISLDAASDGIRYVGTISGAHGFIRVYSRQALSDFNNHAILNTANERNTYYLFDGNRGLMEIRGKHWNTKELMGEVIVADPTSVETFNILKDEYPLDTDGINHVESAIFAAQTRISEATMPTLAFTPGVAVKK